MTNTMACVMKREVWTWYLPSLLVPSKNLCSRCEPCTNIQWSSPEFVSTGFVKAILCRNVQYHQANGSLTYCLFYTEEKTIQSTLTQIGNIKSTLLERVYELKLFIKNNSSKIVQSKVWYTAVSVFNNGFIFWQLDSCLFKKKTLQDQLVITFSMILLALWVCSCNN